MASTAQKLQVLEVPGVAHGATPIPMAVKIGNYIMTSGIEPVDLETGKVGATPERQAEMTFAHMKTILAQGGATLDNVAMVTVYLQVPEYYVHFERKWLETFPDPHNRPACRIFVTPEPPSLFVQVQMIAVL